MIHALFKWKIVIFTESTLINDFFFMSVPSSNINASLLTASPRPTESEPLSPLAEGRCPYRNNIIIVVIYRFIKTKTTPTIISWYIVSGSENNDE